MLHCRNVLQAPLKQIFNEIHMFICKLFVCVSSSYAFCAVNPFQLPIFQSVEFNFLT